MVLMNSYTSPNAGSLKIDGYKGPEIHFNSIEQANRIAEGLYEDEHNYDYHRVFGRGDILHDTPEEAVESLETGGLYVHSRQSGNREEIPVTGEDVRVENSEEPVNKLYQAAQLITQHSDLDVSGYRHGGGPLGTEGLLDEALRSVEGNTIPLMADVTNADGETVAQIGYLNAGDEFGYREQSGDLGIEGRAVLEATTERVLDIDNILETGSS